MVLTLESDHVVHSLSLVSTATFALMNAVLSQGFKSTFTRHKQIHNLKLKFVFCGTLLSETDYASRRSYDFPRHSRGINYRKTYESTSFISQQY